MQPLTVDASNDEIIAALNSLLAAQQQDSVEAVRGDLDIIWTLIAAYLVFFMHAGFSMLETGSVQHKNAVNIMYKNVATVAMGGICYFLFGYAFAYGSENADESSSRFIGSGNYALKDLPRESQHSWIFQYAFAATSATIVSGAVAGRVQLIGYFIVAAYMTSFVYPVVSHWIWSPTGWLSTARDVDDVLFSPNGCGLIDFAGSGVVHLLGGCTAFYGALLAGPRSKRYIYSEYKFRDYREKHPVLEKLWTFGEGLGFRKRHTVAKRIPAHNMSMVTLGTLILWFGWYGFNTGSTLNSNAKLAAKAAITTTLAPSAAVVTGTIISRLFYGHYDLGFVLNSALGGLVAITAGCTVVDDWAAVVIGAVAAGIVFLASKFIEFIGIDDPVDAVAVHGFNGAWGLLAVGIFGTPGLINLTYGKQCDGWETGLQFGTQFVGILSIWAWATLVTLPLFILLKTLNWWRVSVDVERVGLDLSEHGGQTAFIGRDSVTEEDAAALLAEKFAKESEKPPTAAVEPKKVEENEKAITEEGFGR